MINFKGLIAAAALSVLSLGTIPAAEAAYRPCWFGQGINTRMQQRTCWITSRVNYNGHNVIDVTDWNGEKATIVLWTDENNNPSHAEFIYKGSNRIFDFSVDDDGAIRLFDGVHTLVFMP